MTEGTRTEDPRDTDGHVAGETRPRTPRRQYIDPEVASHIGEVPPEPRPFSADAPRAGFESGLIFVFFAFAYGVLGYLMLTEGRIVDFVSLSHLNEGYMALWNDPPKLAALGLDAGTFSSVAYMPLSLVKPLATSLIAIPVLSCVAAGLLMAALNSLLRNCEVNLGFRVALLVLFGLNPMFVYQAANGGPEVLGFFLLALSFSSLISWSINDQTRHLAGSGLAMALAMMVDYQYILVGLGFAVALMIISAAKRDHTLKVRSTLLLFLTPLTYALLFWCLLNWVLVGNPFEWVSAQDGVIQVNTTGELTAVTTDFGGSLGDLFDVVVGIAPLALLGAVLLIVGSFMKRDVTGWAILIVGLCLAAAPVIRAVGADQADLLDLAYGLPLAIFAVAAVAWFGKDGWANVGATILAIGLLAAIPLAWNAMQNYSYQNQAQAFTHWVDGWESQEGSESIGGYTVGIDPELAMARFINNEIPQERRSVLVDQNFSYGVMITSGRPQIFFDRADEGEDDWQATVDNPFGQVSYMLITTSRAGDQIAKKWPVAVEGGEAGMTPIFRTDRYVLVEVSPTRPADGEGPDRDSDAPRTTPNPVTPVSPVIPTGPSLTTPSETPSATNPASPPSPPADGPAPATSPAPTGSSSAPQVEGE